VLLVAALVLSSGVAWATAGFAEYSWTFHDRPGQWVEWHHGDICPPGSPGKDCILVRRTKSASGNTIARATPLPFADPPQALYLNTILAMLPVGVTAAGIAILTRRWRARRARPAGGARGPLWSVILVTLLALAGMPYGLRTLFPASPEVDGWGPPVALVLNVLVVLAPLCMWWAWRRLFPQPGGQPAHGAARAALWMLLLPSGLFTPFLIVGPPNLVLLLLPPLWLPNIGLSLLALWLVAKVVDAARNRSRGGGSPGGSTRVR
jgi:hypothetical protein